MWRGGGDIDCRDASEGGDSSGTGIGIGGRSLLRSDCRERRSETWRITVCIEELSWAGVSTADEFAVSIGGSSLFRLASRERRCGMGCVVFALWDTSCGCVLTFDVSNVIIGGSSLFRSDCLD